MSQANTEVVPIEAQEAIETQEAQSTEARQKKPRSEKQRAQFEKARARAYELRKEYSAARRARDTQAVISAIQDGELQKAQEPQVPTQAAPEPEATNKEAVEQTTEAVNEAEEEEEVVHISRREKAKPKKKVSRRKIVVVEQSSSESSESEVEVILPKRPVVQQQQPTAEQIAWQRMNHSMFSL